MSSAAASGASTEVSQRTFLVVAITLTGITGLFVIARILGSWQRRAKTHKDHIDDYLTVLALAFLAASVAGYNALINAFKDPTMSIDSLLGLAHAVTWVGGFMLWFCKVPILVLYITIFGVKRWLKITSYAIILVSGLVFLGMLSAVTANCLNASKIVQCQYFTPRSGVTLGIFAVLTDALIFLIPLPVVLKLHLPVAKKIGIAIVFAGGLVAIAASAVSTWYKWQSLKWSASTGTNAMICTIVECAVAIMVACVPGLYGLWSHSIVRSDLYSRLSTAFSQIFLVRSRASRSGASQTSLREDRSERSRPSTGSLKMGRVTHTDRGVRPSHEQV